MKRGSGSLTPDSYEREIKRAEKRRMLERSAQRRTFFSPVVVDTEDYSSSASERNDSSSPSPEHELVPEEAKPVRIPRYIDDSESDNDEVDFTFQVRGSAVASPDRPQSDQTPPRQERSETNRYGLIKDRHKEQKADVVWEAVRSRDLMRNRIQAEHPAQRKSRELAALLAGDEDVGVSDAEIVAERGRRAAGLLAESSSASSSTSFSSSSAAPGLRLG